MGIRVLKGDCSNGCVTDFHASPELQKTFNLTADTPSVFYMRADFVIPQATLDAIAACGGAGRMYSGEPIDGDVDGLFATSIDGGATWQYWTDWSPGSPTGTVVTDVWQTELWRFTRNAANDWTADLWVDDPTMSGAPMFSYNNGHTDAEMWEFRLWAGGVAGKGADGEVYYVDNVKVGTTPNGGEYFCSSFEVGIVGWELDGFPVPSVVDDPLGTGGPSSACPLPTGYEVLGQNGIQTGGITYPPVFKDGVPVDPILLTDVEGIPLDWVEHGDSYYILLIKPQAAWKGTTFPPPDGVDANAPLNVVRFPKDGSAPTQYDCGADLSMCWQFASTFGDTPGCFGPQVPGVDCTPGRTGYWWPENFWFTGWQKAVVSARIASDGETLWVAAVAFETEAYPYITSDDSDSVAATCGTVSIPSSAAQFIDISTLTAGFTSFQDAEPSAPDLNAPTQACGTLSTRNDYQRWAKFGRGEFGTDPREPPESDAGDNYSGFYQQAKLVVFTSDGTTDFTRIGDTPANYVYGTTGATGAIPVALRADSMIGDLAACASPAEPGVCHVVWCEGSAYGETLRPGSNPNSPDDAFEVWDTEENTIGYRIAYSRWDGAGNTLDVDLLTSSQDRTDWFFVDGGGDNTDLGPPDDSAYSETLDLRNEHGSPGLFMALVYFFRFASPPHGPTPWSARASLELSYYDLSGGTLALLQTLDAATYASTLSEVQLLDPSLTEPPNLVLLPSIDHNFAVSTLQEGGLLDARYVVGVGWTSEEAIELGESPLGMGLYEIVADGASAFDFLIEDRTLSIAPTAAHPTVGPPVNGIVLDPLAVWMPQLSGVDIEGYATWRLDLGACNRWWERFRNPTVSTARTLDWQALKHGNPLIVDLFSAAGTGLIFPGVYYENIHHHVYFVVGEGQIFTLECTLFGPPVFRNRFKAEAGVEAAPVIGAGHPVFDATFAFRAAAADEAAPSTGSGQPVFDNGPGFAAAGGFDT